MTVLAIHVHWGFLSSALPSCSWSSRRGLVHGKHNKIYEMGFLSFGFGICAGYLFRNTTLGSHLGNKLFAFYKVLSNEKPDNYKLVLVVRDDLKMGRGKIAAQCSHASVLAYKNATLYDPDAARLWEAYAQAKIVLKTNSEQSLSVELYETAKDHKLCTSIVCDSGRTQVAYGTKTVVAVGPGPRDIVDKITGHLKLL